MSRKGYDDGPVTMTASTSRRGRIPALLGVLSTMVRGGRGKRSRQSDRVGGIAVPTGVRVVPSQTAHIVGSDLRLLR